jgi:hypothetical protein
MTRRNLVVSQKLYSGERDETVLHRTKSLAF